MAAYTRCLRCAGAPRRPASGSELSLRVLSWHAVPCDPGESDHCQFQISDVGVAFAVNRAARHSQKSAIRFTREVIFEATWFTQSLRPARLLAPLYGSDRHSVGPRGLLLPGFQQVGLPSCCWISLQQCLDSAGLSPARTAASFAALIRSPRRRAAGTS